MINMNYKEIEEYLIERTKSYLERNDISLRELQENPYVLVPFRYINTDYDKAHATLDKNGQWQFRVIIRSGYTGEYFPTFELSYNHALEECEVKRQRILKQIKERRKENNEYEQ